MTENMPTPEQQRRIAAQITSDASDAAHFAAAMAAGDTIEWQRILDGITDLPKAKSILSALGGIYVRHVQAVCARTGDNPVAWLAGCAVEQLGAALDAQRRLDGDAPG
jgi:hypothetical protein